MLEGLVRQWIVAGMKGKSKMKRKTDRDG